VTDAPVRAGDDLALTVPGLLAEQSVRRQDHDFLVCDQDSITYAGAEARSKAVAKGLLALGVGPGTHVGLLYPNGPAFVIAWLATARIGAVSVPISTFSTASELSGLLGGADVAVLLSSPSFRGRDYVETVRSLVAEGDLETQPLYAASLPSLRRVAFDLEAVVEAGREIADCELDAVEGGVHPSDRMVIVHTSGSTSAPKGVIHEHGALIRHLDDLNRLRRYTEDEILFSNSPFFWIGGFAYSLLGTLIAGATLACSVSPDPATTLDFLEQVRPTMVNGFAASVTNLSEDPSFSGRDLRSIRRGNLWPIMPPEARPADPELRHNMLGMTEAGSVCLASGDDGDQPESRRGSFGRPVAGFEARIVDTDSKDCAPGEVGELWLRSRFLMEGYYGRERFQTFTLDGWFATGDLFRIDEEGFFYFCGRSGDMIKTAGANVSPREVEMAIADTVGLVGYVVGLEDADRGQIVVAALCVPAGRVRPDVDEVRLRLRDRLSPYKVPRRILFLAEDEVPLLSSGKLDSGALKEQFRAS
jgi:acyl-CoA synthetase (AMP-forming)/AMP-acid ligase II